MTTITSLVDRLALVKETLNASDATLTYKRVKALLDLKGTGMLVWVAQRLYEIEKAEGTYNAASWACVTTKSGTPWRWAGRTLEAAA